MKSPSTSSSSYRKCSSFYAITMSFIIFVAILYAEDFTCILKQPMLLKSQKQENLDQPQLMPTQPFPKIQQPKNLDQPQRMPTQPFPKTQEPKNLDQPQLMPTQPFSKSQQLEKLDQPQPIPTQPFLKSQQLENSDKPQLMPIESFLKSQKPETMNQQQVMPTQPFLKSQQQEGFGQPQPISTHDKDTIVPFAIERREECNIFEGRWVYDEATRPQYEESECPYIHAEQTCQAHGRPDKGYLHWRWQPHGCSLPSFNASFMLEKLRGKRMLFVGDSLNRGQFISMVCLLQRAIPEGAKSIKINGALTTFKAKEYNTSVGFYWSPLLSESNADDPAKHRVVGRVVRAGSIKKHTRHWKGADIIVFSSYIWWMTGNKIQILRGSFKDDKKNIEEMEAVDAYRMAMKRVVKWVERDMDPRTTRVFFTSMSPMHERSEEWGGKPGWKCFNETTPITDPNYWGFSSNKAIMRVVGQVFSKAKVPISVLNITQLSEYRRDAHSSIYKNFFRTLTPEQLANPRSYADCVHWCLPGLPDTWNELLYAKLFFP